MFASCIDVSPDFWFYILVFAVLVIIATFTILISTFQSGALNVAFYVTFIIACILFAYDLSKMNFGENQRLGCFFVFIVILTGFGLYASSLSGGKIAALCIWLVNIILMFSFFYYSCYSGAWFLIWSVAFYVVYALV